MSIFTTIIKDSKSVASKIETAFVKLFNEAPTWITIADNTINYVAPIVQTIATLAGDGPLVSVAVTDLKGYLATASAAVDAANNVVNTSTFTGLLSNINNQLPSILAALKIENPALVGQVTTYTTLISGEISALISSIPTSTPVPVTLAAPAVASTGIKTEL